MNTIYIYSECIIAVTLIAFIIITTRCKSIDPVPPTHMSKDQQKIVGMLKKSNLNKFRNNLWDNVCPLCGKGMELHLYGSCDAFSDHWCVHCGFVTKMEVLA